MRVNTLGDIAIKILEVVASLKITVVLFAMSIFLVYAGTLAQTEMGIDPVVKEYFRCWWVSLKFQILFPKVLYPGLQNIPGWTWYPGGWTLGTLLLINLAAAHAIRFKIQSKGLRLWGGLGVIALGMLVTWGVIASGNNKDGFQIDPILEWSVLWQIMKYSLGLLWVGMASSLLRIESNRKLERWTITALTVLLGALVAYVFIQGDDAKLNDSSMRILWQLIKGTIAGVVLLAGCILVFKKRAGIVLLHGGVALIMLNELYVGLKQVENQMPIIEGQTVNWVHDPGQAELAIIDYSPDKKNNVVVIPYARLERAAANKEIIQDDNLPFDIEIVKYFKNTEFLNSPPADNPATQGFGIREGAKAADPVVGTSSDGKVNIASAYVRFFKKGTKTNPIATILVSQAVTTEEEITDGEKTYFVSLRSKRTYKPYSIHLIDARADKYVGSDTTKNFSSKIRLVDKERNVDRIVTIKMNNPLRYAGETFYQSGFQTIPVRVNGRTVMKDLTTLAVVKNSGWMIPYVACMIIATGMLYHFWIVLLRFLNRRAAGSVPISDLSYGFSLEEMESESIGKQSTKTKSHKSGNIEEGSSDFKKMLTLYAPILVVLFSAGWLAGKAVPPRYDDTEMNLYRFGSLPVVYGGRVKPFDSFARNSLRQISTKQTFKDEQGNKRPAIQWLLDMATRPDVADKYRVFYIVNDDLLQELGLPTNRKGFLYSYHEIQLKFEHFSRLVNDARATPAKQRTLFQRKVFKLYSKLRVYETVRQPFLVPPDDIGQAQDEIIEMLVYVLPRLKTVPLSVPKKDDEKGWATYTESVAPLWIQRFAQARGHRTIITLVEDLLQADHSKRALNRLRELVVYSFVQIQKARGSRQSEEALREEAARGIDRLNPALLATLARDPLQRLVRNSLNGQPLDGKPSPAVETLTNIFTAYRNGEAEKFNEHVTAMEKLLADAKPPGYDVPKVQAENWFNYFAPLFYPLFLYLAAFILSACAWLGWSKPLNRTAFWLILLAFLVHTFALGMRMYLSGRMMVTVTNLYSSAVFIGWACCLLGLILEGVFRLGIGNIVASVAGYSTLWIAHLLALDGDTLEVMQAVLDTTFWLATHVTAITLGYATTFVAGLLGIFYILLGIFHPHFTRDAGKNLNRMIYGSVCFAIFFSFIGTVLGGLWADDSWGRFWGWDPKENGALIIVIWNALVLHARWGNMVKDRGMAVLAVGGNIVTCWSWFGVNLLGVGLHNYGFKDGVGLALACTVLGHLAIILLGLTPKELWQSYRNQTQQADA
ncbi:MAG: hypothetical protein Tsb009_08170 [Planctomycetaceae bacterium]